MRLSFGKSRVSIMPAVKLILSQLLIFYDPIHTIYKCLSLPKAFPSRFRGLQFWQRPPSCTWPSRSEPPPWPSTSSSGSRPWPRSRPRFFPGDAPERKGFIKGGFTQAILRYILPIHIGTYSQW